jgi:hypothetical protein
VSTRSAGYPTRGVPPASVRQLHLLALLRATGDAIHRANRSEGKRTRFLPNSALPRGEMFGSAGVTTRPAGWMYRRRLTGRLWNTTRPSGSSTRSLTTGRLPPLRCRLDLDTARVKGVMRGGACDGQAKPKPSDKAVVLLFVVGGVAAHELQQVAAALKDAAGADGDGPQVGALSPPHHHLYTG